MVKSLILKSTTTGVAYSYIRNNPNHSRLNFENVLTAYRVSPENISIG